MLDSLGITYLSRGLADINQDLTDLKLSLISVCYDNMS